MADPIRSFAGEIPGLVHRIARRRDSGDHRTRSPEAMTWFGIIASAKVSSTILGEVARPPLHREGWSSLCRIAHEDIERGGARSPGLEGRGHLHLDPDQRRAGTGDRRYRGAGAC